LGAGAHAGQLPERVRLVGPKHRPERMLFCEPLRCPWRSPLRGREQARVRGLLRLPERRLLRCHGRVQFRAQLQEPEQVQVPMDERAQVRGPVIIPERGQELQP
jgi:hypothetical protein